MHARRGVGVHGAHHVLPHPLGDEGGEGSHDEGHRAQGLVEGGERRRIAVPEATARATHVPVGEVVDEGGDETTGPLGVEHLECRVDVPCESVRLAEHPPVQGGPLGDGRCAGGRCPVGGPRVEGEEGGGVPVGEQDLAHDLLDGGVADAPCLPGRSGGQHEPPHGVSAVLVHERDGLEHVAEVLAHLAAVLIEDVAEAHDVLVRRLVEDERADRHQRVEPPARLVDGLADVVRRVAGGELLGSAMRISELREGHRTGVVPAVDDLGHARGLRAALGAREGHLVDVGAVRVEVRQLATAPTAEVGQGLDGGEMSLGAAPDGQRGAPVAIAGERPVDVVVEPVAVATPLDRLRVPVGALVLPEEIVLDGGRLDVPGRLRVVDERRVASPAVRVGVLVAHVLGEQAASAQVIDQHVVGLLEEHPADEGEVCFEGAVGTHRVDDREAVGAAGDQVVGAEGGSLVHET